MSADYNLEIETQESIQRVAEVIAKVFDVTVNAGKTTLNLRTNGTYVYLQMREALGQRLMSESYGIRPNILATFEYYTDEGIKEGRHMISEAVTALLSEIKGNVVLLYNGEETMLERINEKLTLDILWSEKGWLRTELDESNLNYSVEKLDSPFLNPQVEELQAA